MAHHDGVIAFIRTSQKAASDLDMTLPIDFLDSLAALGVPAGQQSLDWCNGPAALLSANLDTFRVIPVLNCIVEVAVPDDASPSQIQVG